jgi:phasin family protein
MSEVENQTAEAKTPVAKIDAAAEKAYAEAAAKAVDAPKAETAPVAAPVKAAPAAKPAAAPKTKLPAAPKAVPAKKTATKTVKKTASRKTPAKAPAAAKKAAASTAKPAATTLVTKLKETVMTTAKTADITTTAKTVLADVQTRAKTAFAKTGEFTAEATEFAKANVEAVVESGKIFVTGAQELLKDNIETGKTVFETVTEDAKKVAAVKSPTELMQLQGEIARRNFDAMVSYGSKRTEAWVKLTNEAFAPISNRVSVAVEKISKAA